MTEKQKRLNDTINLLVGKLTELNHYLNEYKIIFKDDISSKQLLESTHSTFWNDLYWLYWNFLTIRICCLMEKAETYGNKNLSFYHLLELVSENGLTCESSILKLVEDIGTKILPFKNVRKKAFAHYDLRILLDKKSLNILELDDFEWILLQFSTIINLISSELHGDTYLFGMKSLEGARRMMGILSKGLEYRNNLIKKI